MNKRVFLSLLIAGLLIGAFSQPEGMPEEIADQEEETVDTSNQEIPITEDIANRGEPLINFEDPDTQRISEGLEKEAVEDQTTNAPPPEPEQQKVPPIYAGETPKKKNTGEAENEDLLIDDDEKNIMKEWETHMHDFVPADILTYEIEPRKKEYFFEEIKVVPSYIRGAYFISSDEKSTIDFRIANPRNKTIFKKIGKKEGIFYFNITTKGTYTFIFSNQKFLEKKQITFALHCGNSSDDKLKEKDINSFENRLESITLGFQDMMTAEKFESKRQDTHMKSVKSAHKNLFILTMVETIFIILAVVWQIYYIHKLFDNRRIV